MNKRKPMYDNIEFDSYEEVDVYIYFKELLDNGYIKKIEYNTRKIKLFKNILYDTYRNSKKNINIPKQLLYKKGIKSRIYTPDFIIYWTDKAYGIFYQLYQGLNILHYYIEFLAIEVKENNNIEHISFIEVKGTADKHRSLHMFKTYIQPYVMEKYNIYVNLSIPLKLFKRTFIPEKLWDNFFYKRNSKWGNVGDKKYEWEYKKLNDFVTKQQNEIKLL